MKKKSQWISVAVTFGLLAAGSAEAASDSAAADTTISASTSAPLAVPPSSPIQPFGIYTGYVYLSSSSDSLQVTATGSLSISASTFAKIPVDTIGAKLQLEQWNGKNWVAASAEINQKGSRVSTYRAATTCYVAKGAVYRAKVTHYLVHNGLEEQAVEYTESLYNY